MSSAIVPEFVATADLVPNVVRELALQRVDLRALLSMVLGEAQPDPRLAALARSTHVLLSVHSVWCTGRRACSDVDDHRAILNKFC